MLSPLDLSVTAGRAFFQDRTATPPTLGTPTVQVNRVRLRHRESREAGLCTPRGPGLNSLPYPLSLSLPNHSRFLPLLTHRAVCTPLLASLHGPPPYTHTHTHIHTRGLGFPLRNSGSSGVRLPWAPSEQPPCAALAPEFTPHSTWFSSPTTMLEIPVMQAHLFASLACLCFLSSHLRIFFIDFRERGRERERQKYQSVASHMHPDLGSNPQHFGVGCGAPTS